MFKLSCYILMLSGMVWLFSSCMAAPRKMHGCGCGLNEHMGHHY